MRGTQARSASEGDSHPSLALRACVREPRHQARPLGRAWFVFVAASRPAASAARPPKVVAPVFPRRPVPFLLSESGVSRGGQFGGNPLTPDGSPRRYILR